jgi:hypothetical protein
MQECVQGVAVNNILSLSSFPLLLVTILFSAVAGAVGWGVLRWRANVFSIAPLSLPPATFASTITTVWALSLSFVAADIWNVRADAERAASAENSSINRLLGMSAPGALDAPELSKALVEYRTAMREVEWGRNANAVSSAEVERALQDIRIALIRLAEGSTKQPLLSKMAADFDELQDARNVRLAIGNSTVSAYKWYLVLALTVLAMAAIATVHADRPRAGHTALAIFSCAAVVCLWIIALHASPYAGSASIRLMPERTAALL